MNETNVSERQIAVLLIEDLNGDAKAITQALAYSKITQGLDLVRVVRLQDGIATLNERNFDIILLDLSLPDAKGIKAVVELHRSFPNIPIIVLSDLSDERVIQRALENGAKKFLVKGECSGIVIKQAIYQVMNQVPA